MLLEDAVDLSDFLEATGQTISRGLWCTDVIAQRRSAQIANLVGGLV